MERDRIRETKQQTYLLRENATLMDRGENAMSNETKINPFAKILNAVTKVNPNLVDAKKEEASQTVVNAELVQPPAQPTKDENPLILLGKYSIVKPLDVASGEADLYLCEYQGTSYVAKIYRRDVSIKNEVVQALKGIRSPYVAHMVDTGVVDGKTVEILPYYKNGSLQGKLLPYQELHDTVIPCVNEALKELHQIGVIHKDLKPSNLMLLDNNQDVAIIDFGISSVIDDGRTVLVTKTGMTPEYSAPETFRGVFLEESDYYSFGITLYELFCGRTPYAGMSNDEIAQYMSIQKIPFPDDMPKPLKELISGLTYSDLAYRNDKKNPNRRWTYEEVCKWCDGQPQPIPGEASMNAVATRIPAYKFRGELYTNTTELVRALALDWDNGKKQLYRGLLAGFFMACDPEIAEFCMDAEESVTKKNEDEDVAFWKLLYKVAPDMNDFFWKNQHYDSLTAFGTTLMENLRNGNVESCPAWNEILRNNLISLYMKSHKFCDAQIKGAESIETSTRLNQSNAKKMALNYYLLGYLISGDRTFVIAAQKFDSIDALAEYMNTLLADSFDKFDAFCKNIISTDNSLDPQFEAWLIAQGKSNEIEQWRKTLS